MTSAGGRRITVRSISCRGVRAFVPLQKPPLYAAVSLGGRREKTSPDADGGENPDWDDAAFAFELDGGGGGAQQQQLVEFEVKAQVPLLGNKLVGTASVPVADLAAPGGGGAGDGAGLRHVSYQVSASDGKPNGTLSFSYAISGGHAGAGVRPPPQLYPAPDGARPDQDPSFCFTPPPSAPYAAPSAANFAPQIAGYPPPPPQLPSPPASAPLYPPLQDLLPPSSYPPPPPPNPQFPSPSSSSGSYPPPSMAAYPPPPASCASYPAFPAQYASYPPPPTSSAYPPAPPSGYPPPPGSNWNPPASTYPPPPPSSAYPPAPPSGYPPPAASNLTPPASTYPPPPPHAQESGSAYPVYPRSTPTPPPSTVDRGLPYYPAPLGGSYYPPLGTRHPELDGAGTAPHYYPPPGSRYPYQ